jgi:hypothetical protein
MPGFCSRSPFPNRTIAVHSKIAVHRFRSLHRTSHDPFSGADWVQKSCSSSAEQNKSKQSATRALAAGDALRESLGGAEGTMKTASPVNMRNTCSLTRVPRQAMTNMGTSAGTRRRPRTWRRGTLCRAA